MGMTLAHFQTMMKLETMNEALSLHQAKQELIILVQLMLLDC